MPGVGSVSRAVGAGVIGVWLFAILATGKIRKPTPFLIAGIAFILWNFASIIWSLESDKTMERAMALIRMAFLAWLIWDLFTWREGILRGLQAYVLGCCVSIGSLILNYVNGVEAYRNAGGRVSATGFDANEIGIILAIGMPLAWYLVISKDYKPMAGTLLRYLNYAYIPATIFAIFLTASRGSLLATFPALLFILWTINRLGQVQRVLISILIVSSLFVLQDYVPQASLERISTTGQELATTDLNGRTAIWQDGLELFVDHTIFGTGAGTFRAVIESGKAPHNTALALLTDVGIVGFLLFYITFACCLVSLGRMQRLESRMWLSFLLIWTLGSMVSNWEHKNLSWLLFSMIIASSHVPQVTGAVQQATRSITRNRVNPRLQPLSQRL